MTTIKDGNGDVVLTTLNYEDGVVDHFYNSATLDFPSITAAGHADLTIAVTGAALGGMAVVSPNGAPEAGLVWNAFVSAADTVTVRVSNITAAAIDPASRSWRADVWA